MAVKEKDAAADFRAMAPNVDLKRDLKRLAKVSPSDDDRTPACARLAPFQILEIERMASQGLNLETIAARLMIPLDVWNVMMRLSPEIADAYKAGASRGADWVSEAALAGARGGEASLIKYYLDRFGGPQFKPKQDAPIIIQTGPMIEIDADGMAQRFQRQRALIDGTAEELEGE